MTAPAATAEFAEVRGVRLRLSPPAPAAGQWIGQAEILEQLLACWLVVAEGDLPLAPRIAGPPGIGKTTLAMAAARLRGQPLYIQQCTADTRPEDLLVTPVLAESGKIGYHASPLASAMLCGGVCVLDEGNRMNEKSWASLAGLLDHRRSAESILAGIALHAHPAFRCCVTMNEDESTFEIPDYILSRLQPTLKIGFPERDDELAILRYHLPFAPDDLLGLTVQFLQRSHGLQLEFSPRDGLNVLRFALKRLAQRPDHPVGKDAVWREALLRVLGEEALDLERLSAERRRMAGGLGVLPEGLADFFFDPDDPLRGGLDGADADDDEDDESSSDDDD